MTLSELPRTERNVGPILIRRSGQPFVRCTGVRRGIRRRATFFAAADLGTKTCTTGFAAGACRFFCCKTRSILVEMAAIEAFYGDR
jgi:hypothetical protein